MLVSSMDIGESPFFVSFDEGLHPRPRHGTANISKMQDFPGMAATTLRLAIMASGSAPKHLRSYFTISIWLGSFTSMYGPFSLRITTPRTRMVLPLKWAVGIVNARLAEFCPSRSR